MFVYFKLLGSGTYPYFVWRCQMLNEAGRLKPKFYWIERILGSYEPGVLPATCVFIFTVCCACIFAILQWGGNAVYHPNGPEWWLAVLLTFLVAISLISKSIAVALFYLIYHTFFLDLII